MRTGPLRAAPILALLTALSFARPAQAQEEALPDNCTDLNAALDKLYGELSRRREVMDWNRRNAELFINPGLDFADMQKRDAAAEWEALDHEPNGSRPQAEHDERVRYVRAKFLYWKFWLDTGVRASSSDAEAKNAATNSLEPNVLATAAAYGENTVARWDRELETERTAYARADRRVSQLREVSERLKCNTYTPSTPYNPLSRPVPKLGGTYDSDRGFSVVVTQNDKTLTWQAVTNAGDPQLLGVETRAYVCNVTEVRVDGGDLRCEIKTTYSKNPYNTRITQSAFFEIKAGIVTFIRTERSETLTPRR